MLCIAIIVKNKKTSKKCSLPGFLILRESGDYCFMLTYGKLYVMCIWLPLLNDLKTHVLPQGNKIKLKVFRRN